jgi:L-tartrate/succinate antiporter
MFPTAFAANLLAVGIIADTIGVRISWREWVVGFLPVGLTLLVVVPALLYVIYPPEIKHAPDAPTWAAAELRGMGPMSLVEKAMLASVLIVVTLWIAGNRYTDATTAAILGVVFLVARSVVSWDEVVGNRRAWNIFIWYSTLVTLAGGLVHVKFVDWLAATIEPHVARAGFPLGVFVLVAAFFFLHYLFATASGHAAALLPTFLGVAITLPHLSRTGWALVLSYTLGIMGILTPYATGPAPIYYTSGYIKKLEFWFYGTVLGLVFLVTYMVIGVPWLLWRHL